MMTAAVIQVRNTCVQFEWDTIDDPLIHVIGKPPPSMPYAF